MALKGIKFNSNSDLLEISFQYQCALPSSVYTLETKCIDCNSSARTQYAMKRHIFKEHINWKSFQYKTASFPQFETKEHPPLTIIKLFLNDNMGNVI